MDKTISRPFSVPRKWAKKKEEEKSCLASVQRKKGKSKGKTGGKKNNRRKEIDEPRQFAALNERWREG